MNGNCPNVHSNEHNQVKDFVERENKCKEQIWRPLKPSIKWMESMARKWSGNAECVMAFMKRLVEKRMVESSMNPINRGISKKKKQKWAQRKIENPIVLDIVIMIIKMKIFHIIKRKRVQSHDRKGPK